jgi:hypothetical protein
VTLRAELWADGAAAAALDVVGGSVSIDQRRATRRTVTCDLIDPTGQLVPRTATDLLVPTGTQLRLWRGIQLPDGTTEEAPLGVFRVTEPQFDTSGDGLRISLTGSDESDTVRAARLTTGWTITAGQPVGAQIRALLNDRHPTLPVRDDTNPNMLIGATTVLAAGADSDPWQAACDTATQHGCELFIDPTGTAVIRALPTSLIPVIAYARGTEAVITRLSRKLSTATTYSGVVVASETSDAEGGGLPIAVEIWDTNPSSPTYYLGAFGRRPYFITSKMITTTAQATATAQAHLARVTGILDAVEWDQLVNPALDAGDIVSLYDEELFLDAVLTIEALTIPLTSSGSMAAVTRSREMRPFTERTPPPVETPAPGDSWVGFYDSGFDVYDSSEADYDEV